MKKVKIISDYTPMNNPNYLEIIKDEQGDFHLRYVELNETERNVRVAASGTRYSPAVRKALATLVEVLEKEGVDLC